MIFRHTHTVQGRYVTVGLRFDERRMHFWIVLNSNPYLPASQVKRARDELEGRGPDADPQRKRPKEEKRSGQEDASSANCNRLEISDNDESSRCVDLATVR